MGPGAFEAAAILQKAARTIAARHSISAEVAYCVELHGKNLSGRGRYCEDRSGPRPLVRFDVKTPTGDTQSQLLQISDGKFLWIYTVFMDSEPRLERVDLARVEKAMEKQGRAGGATDPAPSGIIDAAAFGGLAGLLISLQESFVFDTLENEELYDTPVWRLSGRWNPNKLAKLLPELAKEIQEGRGAVDLSKLPPRFPRSVHLWLGKDDLFPYRVEYCRSAGGSQNADAVVAMQLFKVSFNVPLDKKIFEYKPGKIPIADRTAEYITKLSRRQKVSTSD